MKILVTGGAIIRDELDRILLQRRSDYGDWGLPGGGMEAGESIEETMIREVMEETGLEVRQCELYAVYSGERMKYKYPDGNEVVFVMFLFKAEVDLNSRLAMDNATVIVKDKSNESLELEFKYLEEIDINNISTVQRPIFEDLIKEVRTIIRT